jgi:ATP-dependent helicase HrpA
VKVPQRSSAAVLAAARSAAPLSFRFPDLPVLAQREAILAALSQAQVLIVAGDTGSGKSTQLPQYCLESGRGIAGMIAHTQPRRLAARALAARIAEELNQPVGRSVGFRVRFADQVSEATRLVLMTDGLLLAELASDPDLRRYDTIIIDEAHERSLNVDLLMGVLKGLLPRRPDLKLIVTSATLDTERIADFFAQEPGKVAGKVPVVRVGGRGYPIEVRYRGGAAQEDPDLPPAVFDAYHQITAEPGDIGRGDVLVFLPGEREIRDVEEFLQRELPAGVEVLPLYSRLSWEQQQRIFQSGPRQRIVLSTNVAETSVTVPGIRSVIDSGLARISRYSARSRLQRLPIEPISAASAEQRKGRCGRLGPGLCIRLYSEEEYAARPAFTEPEILRTNLAALLLRLAADSLGDAESFPFIDAPDSRTLNDGYRLLQELQALDAERRITALGKAMARLPLDPRLARALIESKRFRAESELLAIVSGLSVADVRASEPRGGAPAQSAEDLEGAALLDSRSEFSALVKLWRAYRAAREGPRRALRTWCRERRFSLLRLSDWEDVHTQVTERARELGIAAHGYSASYTGVHRALLAGFCTMVGSRGEEGAYLGTRGVQFHLFPGSPLARRKPRWVMAANIVETSRVFARRVAQVEPTWIEAAAAHLLKREYLSPDWDEAREEVVARERVSFLGLILSANRVVNYGRIAPQESRRIFAREALVYQRLSQRPDWLQHNDAALLAAQRIEERLRTSGLVQNAEALVAFYDRALPRQVSSAATLEYFSRHLTPQQRAALELGEDDIFARLPDAAALQDFPETVNIGGLAIDVHYRFAPGEAGDGATLLLPLLALPQLSAAPLQSAIPGFLAPRIEALLRSLPKEARRGLIPIPATAREFLDFARLQGTADASRLKEWLKQQRGIPEAQLLFQAGAVPDHLIPQLAVSVGAGKFERAADLVELRRRCAAAVRSRLQALTRELYGAVAWRRFELDELPPSVQVPLAEGTLTLYPTLGVHEQTLQIRLEWFAEEAASRWFDSAPRLARLMLPTQIRGLSKVLAASPPLQLQAAPYMNSGELLDTLLQLTIRKACFEDAEAPRTRQHFEAAINGGRERLHQTFAEVVAAMSAWLAEAGEVRGALQDPRLDAQREAVAESREHVRVLLNASALQKTPPQWTRQLPRYLKAELRRWQRNAVRGPESPRILQQIRHFTDRDLHLQQQLSAQQRWAPQREDLHYWIEEFRVSLYAQELKTLGPISAARLELRAAEIEAGLTR